MESICAARSPPVSNPRALAASYGLAVELADLGTWNSTSLVAEYDARAGVIRINERALAEYRRVAGTLDSCQVRCFIDVAVAHELYHYREATGEVTTFRTRREREEAADRYARSTVPIDAGLAAFLRSKRAP